MGPRETDLRGRFNIGPGDEHDDLLAARLADALEEALDGWGPWLDVSAPSYPTIRDADRERIKRLRALLREVDR